MRLYHGSGETIEFPLWRKCQPYNDYGKAFYLCPTFEKAAEWATLFHDDPDGYEVPTVNEYELYDNNLVYFDFMDGTHSILEWLATLLTYRTLGLNGVEQTRADLMMERYAFDLDGYDYVVGYRADDKYVKIAENFLSGAFDIQNLKRAMAAGRLLDQWAIKNPEVLESPRMEFIGSTELSNIGDYWLSAHQARRDADSLVNDLIGGTGYYIVDIERAIRNEDWEALYDIEQSAHIARKY